MRFRLTDEYKQEVVFRTLPDQPFFDNSGRFTKYYEILEKAKEVVWGYAKVKAKIAMEKAKWNKKKGPQFEVDWTYIPIPSFSNPAPISSPYIVTVGDTGSGSSASNVPVTTWTYTNANTNMKTYTSNNAAMGESVFLISDISDRITAKVKEIVNNVGK
jgi:hypothetical protein